MAAPASISIHVEGSGTGVKSSVSMLPLSPTAKLPPPREFWKLPALTVKYEGL
jgi:hypothetical protein